MADEPPWLKQFEDLRLELTELKIKGKKKVSLKPSNPTAAELVQLIFWLTTPPHASSPIFLHDISIRRLDSDPPAKSEVDLSYTQLSRALTLQFQQLPDVMNFRKCLLPDVAIIGPEQAPEDYSACDLNLRAAEIKGSVVLKGLHLSRPIEAQAIRIKDDFRALDCKVGGSRVQFDYEVHRDRSSEADERASLLLDRADIGGRLLLQKCKFRGPLGLFNTRVRGGVELRAATFDHPAGTAILADGLRVGGDFAVGEGVRVHGQLCMVNARIGGELDLRGAVFHITTGTAPAKSHPLSEGEALTCYRLQVGGSVRLGGRPSPAHETAAAPAHAADAITKGEITKRADLIGCLNFHGATIAGHFRVEGLWMERNGGWRDTANQAAIVLNAAVIGRNLEFIDVFSDRQITLVAAEIKGDLIFSRVRLCCSRVAVFGIRAIIRGHLRLGADRSDRVMDAFLNQHTTLEKTMCSEVFGIVDFSGSTIGGFVDATALIIHGGEIRPLNPADRLSSGKNVLSLVMDEAVIGRRLCLGHDESGGASAILLEKEPCETVFNGTVSLVGLRVRGDVYLSGAEFKAGSRQPRRPCDDEPPGWRRLTELRRAPSRCLRWLIEWPNGAELPNLPDRGQRKGAFGPVAVDLTRARIEGCLTWTIPEAAGWDEPALLERPKDDEPARLRELRDRLKPTGEVHFSQAHVGILLDHFNCWPDPDCLRMDGFVFDELHPATTSITTWDRLGWLRLQEKGSQHFTLKAYDHLLKVYRGMGTEEPVAMVALAKQKAIRDGWPPASNTGAHDNPKVWDKARAKWARSPFGLRSILFWTCGCGYRPVNTIILLAVLMAVSSTLFERNSASFYPVGGWQYPSSLVREYPTRESAERQAACRDFERVPAHMKKDVGEYAWGPVSCVYPPFHSVLQAVDLAVPIIDLGRARYWEALPSHEWLEWYIVFHIFAGHLLVVLLALSPIGILRSANRDRG